MGDAFGQPVNDTHWKEISQFILQQEASDPMLRTRQKALEPTDYFVVCYLTSLFEFSFHLPSSTLQTTSQI